MTRGVGGESPWSVMKHIEGLNFPASKDDVLSKARDHNAPREMMSTLEKLPADNFGGPQDILKAYGRIE